MIAIIKSKAVKTLFAIAFWLSVWQVAAMIISKTILLPSPAEVFVRLWELLFEKSFWISVGYSFLRILEGFVLGIIAGTVFAVLSSISQILKVLIAPLITVIKTTPVASFIIIALIWIGAPNVPIFITALMVTPIIYENITVAVANTDKELIEVTKIFRFSKMRRLRLLYIPSVMPFFLAACATSVGLAWKAGIAAEVLCTPRNSIGKYLFESKLYLEIPDLFAWTVTVIIFSLVLEKIITGAIKKYTLRPNKQRG